MLTRRQLLQAAAGIAVSGIALPRIAHADSHRRLRLAYLLPEDSPSGAGATTMADTIARATNDRIHIDTFPDGTLGNDDDLLKGIQLGNIDLAFLAGTGLTSALPDADLLHIPFLFHNAGHARAMLDGAIGADFLQRLAAAQIVPLAWAEIGMRHITNARRPIVVPENLRDLRIRLPYSAAMMEGFTALGAAPVNLPFPRLHAALRTGLLDGEENVIEVIRAAMLSDVQPFLTLSAHVYSAAAIVMAPDSYDDLSAAERALFAEAARAAGAASRAEAAIAEQAGITALRQAGMRIVTNIDRARFATAMAAATPEFERRFGREPLERIRRVA